MLEETVSIWQTTSIKPRLHLDSLRACQEQEPNQPKTGEKPVKCYNALFHFPLLGFFPLFKLARFL